jgi:hypothetical protein
MALGLFSVAVLLTIAGWVVAARFEARIAADIARVRELPAAGTASGDLPPLIAGYVARAGLSGEAGLRSFQIEQVGEMRMQPEGDWMPFSATQVFAVSEPAFVWSARFKVFRVVDQLVNGEGRLEARVLGAVPVARASGDDITRAQLLRYLAELVWAPRALVSNEFITWQPVSETEVLGVLEYAGERVELRFHFDEQGDIRRVRGQRERSVGGQQVLTPWVGSFSDYRSVNGVRIPTRGEVQWTLDSGPFVYWRGTVTRLKSD